jgi:poly-gamma-glutamate synthesis protein (capsule biosynthesis protein)
MEALMLAFRLLVFGATLLAVATLTLLSTRYRDARPTGQTASTAQTDTATSVSTCVQNCAASYQIVWVGDIMLGDRLRSYVEQNGYAWPFERVRPLLAGDFLIGNAEGPITSRAEPYFPNQRWSYNSQPSAARGLAGVGFDALSLSNNHALDRGPDGLADTIRTIQEAHIRPFGAGLDDAEAGAPLLIDTPYGVVGVVGMGQDWDYGAAAGPGQPGTIPFSDDAIVRLKQTANAAGARWVVAFVHWGENYEKITSEQRRVAALFASAGYDLVIGAHPHVAQEVEVVNGMPVVYSLGNFAFGSPGRYTREMPGVSLIARTSLGQDGFQSIELTCISTDNEVVKYQSRPCTPDQSRTLLRRLGPAVTVTGDKGLVEWPRRRS